MQIFIERSILFVCHLAFVFNLSILPVQSSRLSDESKLDLAQNLFENFFKSNLNNVDGEDKFKESLKSFQLDVLKKRNSQCFHENHRKFNFSHIKFEYLNLTNRNDQFFKSLINSFADAEPKSNEYFNLTNKIVDEFNKMVIFLSKNFIYPRNI